MDYKEVIIRSEQAIRDSEALLNTHLPWAELVGLVPWQVDTALLHEAEEQKEGDIK